MDATETDTYPIPDNAFHRRMKDGHLTRTGHTLEGFYVRDGALSTLVRTCKCGPGDIWMP